jgi:RHS repeat-associated protein
MQGQYDDGNTGLYYNTFRYYDADAGRYSAEDPIELAGGLNLYAYTHGNPLNTIDPEGLDGTYIDTDYEGPLYPGKKRVQSGYLTGSFDISAHSGVMGTSKQNGDVLGADGKFCSYNTKCTRLGLGLFAGVGVGGTVGIGTCDSLEKQMAGTTYGVGFNIGLGTKGFSAGISGNSSGVAITGGFFGLAYGFSIGFDRCETEVSCK